MQDADRPLTIEISAAQTVSALLRAPEGGFAGLVLAHGAGAGMRHPFMAAVADGLAARGVATLRYQFPYMEAGSKRPDGPAVAHRTVRAALATAAGLFGAAPLFAGGKSFGGRMTSQAQAERALVGVKGLVFFSFPLHPAGKPGTDRARHLADVKVPMLFLQGSRDALAEPGLLSGVVRDMGGLAAIISIPGADHSFHVPVRKGSTDQQVLERALDDATAWMQRIARQTS